MNSLLELALAAHGGLDRFQRHSHLTAKLHQGGALWALKGQPHVLEDCHVRVDLRQQQVSHWPFAPTRNRSFYTPDHVTIATPEGQAVEELASPRGSFEGYAMETHWSETQLAYFAGYTMWTYLTSPFILARPDVTTKEIGGWSENGEVWRRLHVVFPPQIATHSAEQTFYFNSDGLLVRHDYEVDIQGRNAAARYLTDPVDVGGIIVPGKMRIYPRRTDNQAMPEPLIVSVDLSEFHFD